MDNIPSDKGTYILIIKCPKKASLRVGSLGTITVNTKDIYVYVGSAFAKGGLASRIRRHLRYSDKKVFWHIDYVLNSYTGCRTVATITIPKRKVEHNIAKHFSLTFKYIPKFGSSDCKCPSHFFVIETMDLGDTLRNINKILEKLNLKFKIIHLAWK